MKQLFRFVLFLTISISAQAKWATFEHAPYKASYDTEMTVKKDGTIKSIINIQLEILKEPGRDIAANYSLIYNEANTKINILDAKTIYKDKEYELAKNLIEDKPLASSHSGFDQKRQILLAFPNAEIGAKIVLKYEETITEVPLPNVFTTRFIFGKNEFIDKDHIKINSKIPLHILVNDPENILKIKKDKKDSFNKLEIDLAKPIYKEAINEPMSNIVDDKYLTWVSVSSIDNWKDFAAEFGKQYVKVYTQTLPKEFQQIADIAAQKKDEVEQINTVTSLLNDKVRYMGDWRTIRGGFIPRDLNIISKTQLGDCKDFSSATAAILKELGYKTQIVFVLRGVGNFYPEKALPSGGSLNHAMVKVTNKEEKVYWIDPTNFQSMADGIFPDIANKMVLILDPKQPSHEKIPNINHEHAQVSLKRQMQIMDNDKIIETGNITFKNEEAYPLTGITLRISEENVKDQLYNSLSRSILEEKNKKYLHLPDLTSRIVKDISIDYSFEQENGIFKTNAGQAIQLNYYSLDSFINSSQDNVTDLLIPFPFTTTKQTIIKNINAQNIESLNKEIKTQWLYVKRNCTTNNDGDVQIDDTIIIYKNLIPNEETKTPEFIKLKTDLETNFKDVAVVFNREKR